MVLASWYREELSGIERLTTRAKDYYNASFSGATITKEGNTGEKLRPFCTTTVIGTGFLQKGYVNFFI